MAKGGRTNCSAVEVFRSNRVKPNECKKTDLCGSVDKSANQWSHRPCIEQVSTLVRVDFEPFYQRIKVVVPHQAYISRETIQSLTERMTHVNRKRDKLEHGSTFYDSLELPEREFALYNRNSSGAQTTSVNSFLIA
ncbi:hypothetical protein RRG08_030831 [Elysia crispata]|uniref:Uncharacterized protein n=1 Tax=Elysia crispata TaxID=231223 RepID=A0AAE1ACL3_9GAST|nr:hypothetical protein RRG08_030831 [Elysia crispata]